MTPAESAPTVITVPLGGRDDVRMTAAAASIRRCRRRPRRCPAGPVCRAHAEAAVAAATADACEQTGGVVAAGGDVADDVRRHRARESAEARAAARADERLPAPADPATVTSKPALPPPPTDCAMAPGESLPTVVIVLRTVS
jgi:hypothetical protein